MILLIDNYDSFVHNLSRYLQRLGQETLVVRNDKATPALVRQLRPDALVLSPGPCSPNEAGCSMDVVRTFWQELPMLGVCLGHQAIAAAFGGRITRAPLPMHGRTSDVLHEGTGVFAGVPSPFVVCRYHSLVVDPQSLPANLRVSAQTADGVVMGIRDEALPVVGLQFHPEAILTHYGYQLLANFLTLAGLKVTRPLPDMLSEYAAPPARQVALPITPVTF